MDISKWLAETESPVPFKRLDAEQFPRPDPLAEAQRKRQRSSSDSSLVTLCPPQPQPRGISAIERNRDDVQDDVDSIRSDTPPSIKSDSTDSSRASNTFYSRRRRHKTRPDKYEIRSKARKQGDSRDARRRNEPRKPKRKYKRIADGKTDNGVGREFRARNVSKDRLTVSVSYMLQTASMLIANLAKAAG